MEKNCADFVFETERLRVRYFKETDHDHYFSLQGNPAVMQYIRPVRTREQTIVFLNEKILGTPKHDYKGYWAVEKKHTAEFIGCFVIIPMPEDPDKTQMGYSFLPQHWGNGYATEVATRGVEYFYNKTPLPEIYGVTEKANLASQKVLLKAGFVFFEKKMEEAKELVVYILRR